MNVDYIAVCVEDLTGVVRYERRVYGDNRGSCPGPCSIALAALAREELDGRPQDGPAPGRGVGGGARPRRGGTGTLVFAPNLGWLGDPRRRRAATRGSGFPVHVENEANLAALAEHWSGAARGLDDFVCVFGEVGVGGGIVIGGQLFRGTNGFGGELGHVPVEHDGTPCACGSLGCVETLVGQEAIAAAAGVPFASDGRGA